MSDILYTDILYICDTCGSKYKDPHEIFFCTECLRDTELCEHCHRLHYISHLKDNKTK